MELRYEHIGKERYVNEDFDVAFRLTARERWAAFLDGFSRAFLLRVPRRREFDPEAVLRRGLERLEAARTARLVQ